MSEQLQQIPQLNPDVIPPNLHTVATVGQELITKSHAGWGQENFIPCHHIDISDGMHRAFWEKGTPHSLDPFERLAVHLGPNSLMISHEHQDSDQDGRPLPSGFLRTTLVIEKKAVLIPAENEEDDDVTIWEPKGTLYHFDTHRTYPRVDITDSPERVFEFHNTRLDHAIGSFGIQLASPLALRPIEHRLIQFPVAERLENTA